ncbi:YfmQ family protein [Peribacillus loiseleuriae]|uniref:YfmQ family protein n=1 Tax=Peribacillus loiseleuriae TaxID=1679170 RepID=UPI003D029FFD
MLNSDTRSIISKNNKAENHVDVVKQCKEKVVSYSLSSDYLQKFTMSTKELA